MSDTMGYHRAYRPISMNEFIGNDKMKESVHARLEKGIRPQTILLQGSTGCGKTTFARLLAKEYSCEAWTSEKGACGECDSCKTIENYILTGDTDSLLNVEELNASQERGVNYIDELVLRAAIPAFGDEWKVYIIDEAQRISSTGQDSMLKILEEPPERVLFILCTTDVSMLQDTIINRMKLKLTVKVTLSSIQEVLSTVCSKKMITHDDRGLSLIADKSKMTIRTALNLLEDVVAIKSGARYEDVVSVFDDIHDKVYFEFLTHLINKNITGFIKIITDFKSSDELSKFYDGLIVFITRGIQVQNGLDVKNLSVEELKKVKSLFTLFTISELGELLYKLNNVNMSNIDIDLMLIILYQEKTPYSLDDIRSLVEESKATLSEEQKEVSASVVKKREGLQKATEEAIKESSKLVTSEDVIKKLF